MTDRADRRPVRIIAGWLVVSVGLILASTLFPFDFHSSGGSLWTAPSRLDVDLRSQYVFQDMPANIALFAPLGFSLAACLHLLFGAPRATTLGLAAAAGVLLSLVLESVQGALLLRFASLGDVISNGIGAAGGALLGLAIAEWVLARLTLADGRGPRCATRIGLASLLTLAVLVVTVRLDHAAAPSGWSSDYPLVIGNETSADRPWSGTIAAFEIVAPGASDDVDGRGHRPLAAWNFVGGPTGDPALAAVGARAAAATADGVTIGPDRWWRSIGPVGAISSAIVAAGGFEIVLDVATASVDQTGPARILSISDGITTRNLTIGQSGEDLALRVRSDLLGTDGSDPEILVPGVFARRSMQRIVVRFVDEAVQVEVDGDVPGAHALDLGAEVAVALWSFPHSVVWMRTGGPAEDLTRFTYRAAVLFPWGIALAGLTSRWGRRRVGYVVATAIAIAAGFELVLVAAIDDYAFEVRWVAVGAVCIGAVAALFRCPASADVGRAASRRDVTRA